MSNQYPNDPYSASILPDAAYYTDTHQSATEFSPFFTSDYLPLSTPPTPVTTLPTTFNTTAYPYGAAQPSTASGGTGNVSGGSYNEIEEEKRRRNTAASARFRVKKKEREQVLEKTANEVREKVRGLEGRVQMLERENGWLRGLVGEKRRNLGLGGGRRKDDDEGEDEGEEEERKEVRGKKKKGRSSKGEDVDDKVARSPRKRNDGVGTGR
ncbi:hypothetical protein E2P81_ATG08965 [Venturia nashicola]|uniref:BZIP domain-containing protein n=1 Tax=Venturia nashicola TaxID=86259 RepID=A0A4Z1P396_9PEZI|nr:hypothetical protein E6O75_ATG09166 [Venturia nashicola]TLD23621.1 hypothetical protein E2P81_ATG08965 [Venturia nashicola]